MENRRKLGKIVLIGVSLCLAAVLFFLSPMAGEAAPKYGGTAKLAVARDPGQIGDPATRPFNLTDFRLSAPILETLFRYDTKGMMIPWLATGYEIAKDLKSITITLRKGIKFQDGTDFNAEAVKWNLDRYRTSKNPELQTVSSVEIVDPYSVKLNLSSWSSTLVDNFTLYPGLMISPTAFKERGPDKIKLDPVGTGPFKFKSWQRNTSLKLEKFDGYWQKGKPYLDEIEYLFISTPMTRASALKAGEVDGVMTVEFQFLKDLMATGNFYTLEPGLSNILICYIGDSAHPDSPFSDIRVRRALNYAVDSKQMVETINYGYGEVLNQYGTKGSWGYNPNVKGYPYDPEKAKKLLAEAGYGDGLNITLTGASWGTYAYYHPAIQAYLRQVGINAEIILDDPGKHDALLYKGWNKTWMHQAGRLIIPDAANNLMVYASCMSDMALKGTMLCPDDFMDALKKAQEASDFETKQKWTWEAQRLMVDEYCLINFYITCPRVQVFNKKLHDINWEVTTTVHWTPEDTWKD
ncbi:MAG: ABC transporter substrate-binding protein [Deltaproteobacteria bacterium]|nr:ABC transporter substrate-binding protein [Deltaproteobacteria bacterium]